MRESITAAATRVLVAEGLAGWSVDRVAAEAGCAKGLVHYHHRNKRELLAQVGSELAARRRTHRLEALAPGGAPALDRLWQALVAEVRSREFAAWCALLAAADLPDPPRRAADAAELAGAVASALELPPWEPSEALLLAAALDGFQLALQHGAPEPQVREAYHRLWLTLLP